MKTSPFQNTMGAARLLLHLRKSKLFGRTTWIRPGGFARPKTAGAAYAFAAPGESPANHGSSRKLSTFFQVDPSTQQLSTYFCGSGELDKSTVAAASSWIGHWKPGVGNQDGLRGLHETLHLERAGV